MAKLGLGLDLFLFPRFYIDVASIGSMSALTGGETFMYSNYIASRDLPKFTGDLIRSIRKSHGRQCLFKMRCSSSLSVVDYIGTFYRHKPSEVSLPNFNADKAITVVFKHLENIDSKFDAHFQCTLLYTTVDGSQRLRCHNLVVGVTHSLTDVIRLCDWDTCASVIAKTGKWQITVLQRGVTLYQLRTKYSSHHYTTFAPLLSTRVLPF